MKTSLACVTLALCAALPAGADNAAPHLDELNTRNCMRLMQERQTPQEGIRIERPDDLTSSNCMDLLTIPPVHQTKLELSNLSADTTLANCARMYFSMPEDGAVFKVEPDFEKCGVYPDCTSNLTLLATDGLHHAQEKSAGRLIRMVVHDTGRWLSLKHGEFSCTMPEKRAAHLR